MARVWYATLAAVPAGDGPIVARDVSARGAKQYTRLVDARAVLELHRDLLKCSQ